MKAKAQLAESRKVEVLSKTISKQVTEDSVTEYDNSTSDDDQLVIDTARNRNKTKENILRPQMTYNGQRRRVHLSSPNTQPLPQLEV